MSLKRPLASLLFAVLSIAGPLSVAPVDAQTVAQAAPSVTPVSGATISGIASDVAGKPLGGVTISVTGPTTATTVTDSNGAYSFSNLTPGVYQLSASLSGYEKAGASDVAVAAGTASKVDVTLASVTLSSLRVIATTRTAARSGFNTSGTSVSTIGGTAITDRQLPNLGLIAQELPGVTQSLDSGSRTPNTSFTVRGLEEETKLNIDGHPLSSGVFGTYFSQFANPDIFQQVEVLKGAGLNGVNAGESAVGTINLQTRDFSPKNGVGLKVGDDSFGGQNYSAFLNWNFLKDNKLQFLAARSYQGVNGPDQGDPGDVIGQHSSFNSSFNTAGTGLVAWQQQLSDPYTTQAELLKARYKFSNSTAVSFEYLGLQGSYNPQGGSYAFFYGDVPVPLCYTVNSSNKIAGPGTSATCGVGSVYNDPKLQVAGQNQNLYGYFPNSFINNFENEFSAEFRTSIAKDTLLIRPYVAQITRSIDGSQENKEPGYGSGGPGAGWYEVTSTASCASTFTYSATGSSGPCFSAQNGYGPAYIGTPDPTKPVNYNTTDTAPVCTVAAPCWTTPTNRQQNGHYGFSTPFSQPEVDRIRGITFSYLHPVKDNLFTLSFDANKDDTLKFSGDTSPIGASCNAVVGSGVANTPGSAYYQPDCTVGGTVLTTLPQTALQIPPTQNLRFDTSATALLQVTPQFQVGLGGYYTFQKIFLQYTDPSAAAAAATAGFAGGEPAALSLLSQERTHAHMDPHVQLEYRLDTNLSLRATAGSSTTTPYAGVVSGLEGLSVNSGPTGMSDTVTAKNPNLLPETTVAYDLGFDERFAPAEVLSMDVFDDTVHDVWVTPTAQISTTGDPFFPGRNPPQGTFYSATQNGALLRSFGLELGLSKTPLAGFGYNINGTLDRAYYDGFGDGFYKNLSGAVGIVNYKQLDGTGGFEEQVPYFKGHGELNYHGGSQRYSAAFGEDFLGNNNASGGPPYFQAYGNFFTVVGPGNLSNGLRLGVAIQNLFNYQVGTQAGSVYAYQGFNPIGAVYKNGAVVDTTLFSTPNGLVVIPPRNIYLQLSKQL